MARRKTPRIPDALLDQLLAGADPRTAFDAERPARRAEEGPGRAGVERRDGPPPDRGATDGNSRNGYGRKTVTTDTGTDRARDPAGSAGDASTRSSSPSISAASPASTTRSSRCTRAA